MPLYFPQIAGGIMTSRPYSSDDEFLTTVRDVPSGRRYSWSWRSSPLKRFNINFSGLTDAEFATVETFFNTTVDFASGGVGAEGRLGTFSFMDPDGNLVTQSDNFADASWTKSNVSVGAAATDPYGGSLAFTLTSSGDAQVVAGGLVGDVSGFTLCASVWAKAASGGQSLRIALQNGGPTVTYGEALVSIPQGVWKRIYVSATISDSDDVYIVIGGESSWVGTSIDLFSAQVTPTPGPGPRIKTPGNYGHHQFCRFDTDTLSPRYLQPNQIALSLPIVTFNGS